MWSSLLPFQLAIVVAAVSMAQVHIVFPRCEDAPPPAADAPQMPFVDPRIGGGRMLDWSGPNLTKAEPLNVIVSGLSDPAVLTHEGFQRYVRSIGFSNECLGLHLGDLQWADLGDGLGRRPEQFLARQTTSLLPMWGTCWESLAGGNHFRSWKQNGTNANTGAWFLAVSAELSSRHNHMIRPDGYNIGRDLLVERAVRGGNWKSDWWKADVDWVEGLLQPGKRGINHNISIDGLVAVLTVKALFVEQPILKSLWNFLRFFLPFLPL